MLPELLGVASAAFLHLYVSEPATGLIPGVAPASPTFLFMCEPFQHLIFELSFLFMCEPILHLLCKPMFGEAPASLPFLVMGEPILVMDKPIFITFGEAPALHLILAMGKPILVMGEPILISFGEAPASLPILVMGEPILNMDEPIQRMLHKLEPVLELVPAPLPLSGPKLEPVIGQAKKEESFAAFLLVGEPANPEIV